MLMISAAGGINIEDVAEKNPEKIAIILTWFIGLSDSFMISPTMWIVPSSPRYFWSLST